jgi:hypothetical protein
MLAIIEERSVEERSRLQKADRDLHKAWEDLYVSVMSNAYLHGAEAPATKEAYRTFAYANGRGQEGPEPGRSCVCLVDDEVVVELECELL